MTKIRKQNNFRLEDTAKLVKCVYSLFTWLHTDFIHSFLGLLLLAANLSCLKNNGFDGLCFISSGEIIMKSSLSNCGK